MQRNTKEPRHTCISSNFVDYSVVQNTPLFIDVYSNLPICQSVRWLYVNLYSSNHTQLGTVYTFKTDYLIQHTYIYTSYNSLPDDVRSLSSSPRLLLSFFPLSLPFNLSLSTRFSVQKGVLKTEIKNQNVISVLLSRFGTCFFKRDEESV